MSKLDSDPQAALPLFDRAIELARKHGNRDIEAYGLSAKGMVLARLGHFAESQEVIRAALEIVSTMRSPVTASDVELFAGWAFLDMRDAQAGLEHGRRGVELAVATDNFDCICSGLACVGFGHMQSHQLPEAAGAFRDAIQQTSLSGAVTFEVLSQGGLALTQMADGQSGALAELEQTVVRAQEINDPYTAAMFSQAVADARLGQGDLEGAQTYLVSALEYFRRNDMRPYLARAQATQVALLERQARATSD
jgi:tetratricopeptide (TPR) repeat protein